MQLFTLFLPVGVEAGDGGVDKHCLQALTQAFLHLGRLESLRVDCFPLLWLLSCCQVCQGDDHRALILLDIPVAGIGQELIQVKLIIAQILEDLLRFFIIKGAGVPNIHDG